MSTSPIKFGTSGWRGLIADDFTFANVRLAVTAIAEHVNAKAKEPTILVGYDTRFYSEEFSQLAVDILQHHGIRTLLCETSRPRPRWHLKSCAANSTAPSTSRLATIPRNTTA
jgi:phosphomannomutase